MSNGVVSVDDLGELLNVEVPDSLYPALELHLDLLVGNLEAMLGKGLSEQEVTETVTVQGDGTLPPLRRAPVKAISDAQYVEGGRYVNEPGVFVDDSRIRLAPGARVSVTYIGGLADDQLGAARMLVLSKASAFFSALTVKAAQVAQASSGDAGAIEVPVPPGNVKNFSVEGLNVTFATSEEIQAAAVKLAVDMAAAATFKPEELLATRLMRRVVA